MKKYNFVFLCFVVIFVHCGLYDTKLEKKDFEWINMYKIGDTLVFKSVKDKNIKNTIVVTQKNTHPYKNHPPLSIDEICELEFKGHIQLSANLKSGKTDGAELRVMYFKEGQTREMNIGDTIVQNVFLENVSIYNTPWVGVENEVEPKEVYWRKKDGIVAYVRRNGEMFIFYKKY